MVLPRDSEVLLSAVPLEELEVVILPSEQMDRREIWLVLILLKNR